MKVSDLQFNLGDARLNKTAADISKRIIDRKTAVVKVLGDNAAEEKRYHRLINNDKVTPEKLIMPYTYRTSDICSTRKHVLLLQDTTEYAVEAANKGSRPQVGLVGHDKSIGFPVHATLALDADTHECLGIADAEFMRKTEKSKLTSYERNCQKIEEKSSYRWINSINRTTDLIDKPTMITYVADREADIYELFHTCDQLKCHFVIRSSADRNTDTEKEAKVIFIPTRQRIRQFCSLREVLDAEEVFFEYDAVIPRISGERKERNARFQVKFVTTEIRRTSRKGYPKDLPRTLPVNCIEVIEIDSSDSKPIYWRILTSHKVESIEDCKKIIEYYKARWNIEQLFRATKKQGLRVESNQGKTYESLVNIAAVALISACQTMQLVKAMEIDSECEPPAEHVFDKESISVLESLNKQYQGKTKKLMNLAPHGSLRWAAWIIARMGGWNGYVSQGKPGPLIMRRGLEKFSSFEQGWYARGLM